MHCSILGRCLSGRSGLALADKMCFAWTGRIAKGLKELGRLPCKPIMPGDLGHQRRKMLLQNFEKAKEGATDQTKEDIAKLIETLDRPARESIAKPAKECLPKHADDSTFISLVKPAGSTLRWICTVCKRAGGSRSQLKRQPCQKLEPGCHGSGNRVNFLLKLRKTNRKGAKIVAEALGMTAHGKSGHQEDRRTTALLEEAPRGEKNLQAARAV